MLIIPLFSGCLSLVTMREMMESERGEPQIEQTIETHTIAHIFSFNSLDDIQVYENTTSFYVREDASEIVIYFKATFAGSDQIGQFGCNELVSRYVNARLINADGDVVWSENVCEDYNPMNTHLYPESDFSTGEWTIDVEARGFGEEFLGTFKDSFSVVVTVYKDCLEYPTEDLCVDA